jgi:hypothetical protein
MGTLISMSVVDRGDILGRGVSIVERGVSILGRGVSILGVSIGDLGVSALDRGDSIFDRGVAGGKYDSSSVPMTSGMKGVSGTSSEWCRRWVRWRRRGESLPDECRSLVSSLRECLWLRLL